VLQLKYVNHFLYTTKTVCIVVNNIILKIISHNYSRLIASFPRQPGYAGIFLDFNEARDMSRD